MQNLANFTSTEGVVVGSALLVLCAAPTVLAWSDARRRRRALAAVAARERALVEAAAREQALAEAAARQALSPDLPSAGDAPAPGRVDPQELWDEPTVTVDANVLNLAAAAPVAAAVFEAPVEPSPPVSLEELPPIAELTEPLPVAEVIAPPPIEPVTEPRVASVNEAPSAAAPHFEFCLQELRRVRLPNWPPADVKADPVRNEVWREAEHLASQHQRQIGAAPLISRQPAQSSCLGSAEADAAGVRLHFLLFPVLWPSTEEQATAEAIFEIDRSDGTIRSYVNSLPRSSS